MLPVVTTLISHDANSSTLAGPSGTSSVPPHVLKILKTSLKMLKTPVLLQRLVRGRQSVKIKGREEIHWKVSRILFISLYNHTNASDITGMEVPINQRNELIAFVQPDGESCETAGPRLLSIKY
jgi:hypothetical protein